ncbi:ankyrin repeat-containing domain protein [Circinella umbellata]|nr:ankyrin repeat-containing domain protein [Circinella umbellata]
MFGDEREETLREVAALGNTRAVQHFAKSGVNLNSQNKMNGWTALHWASHRGQEDVVRVLLQNGADPNIKTNKGQTALDLAAKPSIQSMFGDVTEKGAGPEPELSITPTYIKEPDLEKSWLHPDEFSESKVENVLRKHLAEQDPSPQSPPVKQQKLDDEEEKEILVYLKSRSDETILGSVFLKNESIESSMNAVRQELDGLPKDFSLARNNGKVTIPINTKQMDKRLLDIFRGDDDVLIIVPK